MVWVKRIMSNRMLGVAGLLAIAATMGGVLGLDGFDLSQGSVQARPRLLSATKFEILPDVPVTPPRTLVSGPIKVIVDAKKSGEQDSSEYTVNYEVFYNNTQKFKAQVSTWMMGTLELKDIDGDAVPEVIVSTYSGGAHCCTNFTIHGWRQGQSITTETGPLNSDGGEFKDLDGDGKQEFLSVDNAFLYAFDSYAGSFPPSRIYQYKAGKLVDVTRKYPKVLRAHAWRMYQTLRENPKEMRSMNGVLAGYVAQKILLGEYKQGWDLMLATYDRKSEWGLEIYKGDKVVGKYPNFPTALKAFLIDTRYLDKAGKPIVKD
jgi:hypothetical protein